MRSSFYELMFYTMQCDDIDLGRYAKTEKDEATDTSGNAHHAAVALIESVVLGIDQLNRTDAKERNLSAMGVSAERQRHTMTGNDMIVPSPRIMLKHDDKGFLPHPVHRAGEVAAVGLAKVLLTGNNNRVTATMERKMTVEQQFPSHAPLQVDDKTAVGSLHVGTVVGVLTIIMIAQHGDDAIAGPQLPEQRHDRNDLLRTDVLQISAKSDEVGMLGVDTVDVALQQRTARTGETAHMRIREKHDAVAVEALGKIGKIEVVALYGQFLGSYRGTIDEDVPVNKDEHHRHDIAQIDTAVSPTAPQQT